MFFKIIICLLIIHKFEIESKAWPDQIGWGNPPYRDYYGEDSTTTTTTTVKPLYPTLYPTNPRYNPTYYPSAPFNSNQNEDFGHQQVPINPFTGQPLYPQQPLPPQQPNYPDADNHFGRPRNQTFDNRNDYSNNNFNNTRTHTTYPPFNGSTRRNTFPTRRNFNTLPPVSRSFNNTLPVNPNPPSTQYNNNYQHNSDRFPSSHYNPSQNIGNNYNNYNNSQNRQFPSHDVLTNRNSFGVIPSPQPISNQQFVTTQITQQPDYHPSGIALAPFPDENQNSNNFGARKNFNYDNLYRRQPQSDIDVNSRFSGSSSNINSQVPLASYGGAYVPLAPL